MYCGAMHEQQNITWNNKYTPIHHTHTSCASSTCEKCVRTTCWKPEGKLATKKPENFSPVFTISFFFFFFTSRCLKRKFSFGYSLSCENLSCFFSSSYYSLALSLQRKRRCTDTHANTRIDSRSHWTLHGKCNESFARTDNDRSHWIAREQKMNNIMVVLNHYFVFLLLGKESWTKNNCSVGLAAAVVAAIAAHSVFGYAIN